MLLCIGVFRLTVFSLIRWVSCFSFDYYAPFKFMVFIFSLFFVQYYTTIVDVCKWILDLQLKWTFTADVKYSFHQIPIWRQQIKFVGIRICGMSFFWTTLVFGLASSCNIWGEFAALVTWIIINNELDLFLWQGRKLLLQYADDWIGGHVARASA